jgi:hypothetical protein
MYLRCLPCNNALYYWCLPRAFLQGKMDETKQAIGWKIYSALASDAFR